MTTAKLLGELLHWLQLAFRLFTGWQAPFALFAKWQCKEFSKGELLFVAVGGDADCNSILRYVTAQSAV